MMERGIGGRIEDAFAAAKESGEAAFITFVTAGYPCADGKSDFFLRAHRVESLVKLIPLSYF